MTKDLLPGEREVYRTGLHLVLPVGSALLAAALIAGIWVACGSLDGDAQFRIVGVVALAALPCVAFAFLAYRVAECVVTNRRVLLKAGVLIRKTTEVLLTKVGEHRRRAGPSREDLRLRNRGSRRDRQHPAALPVRSGP